MRERIAFFTCLTVVLLGSAFLLIDALRTPSLFGASDFIEYWTANQLFLNKQNPYDPNLLLALQQSLGRDYIRPMMMWNPPWLLVLLQPLLAQPFASSANILAAVNVVLAIAAALFGVKASCVKNSPVSVIACVVVAVTFFPVAHAMILGQVSILIAFGVAGLYWSLTRSRDLWVGVFLTLLTIKPHLMYLLLIAVGSWAVCHRRYQIIAAFSLLIALLMAITALLSPSAIGDWFVTITTKQSDPLLVSADRWVTSTLASDLRKIIFDMAEIKTSLPLILIPLIAIGGFFIFTLRCRCNFNWRILFPPLACISLYTAPFAWEFDAAALLPIQSAMAASILGGNLDSNKKYTLLTFCILPQLLGYLWRVCGMHEGIFECHVYGYGTYSWLPMAVAGTWYVVQKYTASATLRNFPGESLP